MYDVLKCQAVLLIHPHKHCEQQIELASLNPQLKWKFSIFFTLKIMQMAIQS